jgi:hypothetical protein
VRKVLGLVNDHPKGAGFFRSEAEELGRGFGVQGKGASPFIPRLSLYKHDSFLIFDTYCELMCLSWRGLARRSAFPEALEPSV